MQGMSWSNNARYVVIKRCKVCRDQTMQHNVCRDQAMQGIPWSKWLICIEQELFFYVAMLTEKNWMKNVHAVTNSQNFCQSKIGKRTMPSFKCLSFF